ncbi:MAG TPA: Pvc16 family protein [Anaerolineae bacterium]|nr:Pvc16 family protein [Anaerolineae bacterium]HPL29866.1 Pvc16 family protein [Anaerolineae bacterium]
MIDELDEVLRQLLIRELPAKNGEVIIDLQQPRREWSARLDRPTLNLFLHHLCENTALRQPEWQVQRNDDGTATRRRTPLRMDLHYMITAWAADPEDEHRLLARSIMALARHATLPQELLPESLRDQPVPIPLRVAGPEDLRNPADLWSALDNELRPALACIVTLALNPYQSFSGPLVRTRELRFGQARELPLFERLAAPGAAERLWLVGGTLRGTGAIAGLRLTLVERGLAVPVQPDGRFTIGSLEAGEYTLELATEGGKPRQQRITVPSENYDLEV